MDDPTNTTLTAQFGHTALELVNLFLTGRATSGVHNDSRTIGGEGGLVLEGLKRCSDVGHLSQLESMRYLEVGSYYKTPNHPVWLLGSQGHFTVLFGGRDCLSESASDKLLERCRRAFHSAEGGAGRERGFVGVDSLDSILDELGLLPTIGIEVTMEGEEGKVDRNQLSGVDGRRALLAALEIGGAGIILWNDFWRTTSRLLTGASLELVLQGGCFDGDDNSNIQDDVVPRMAPASSQESTLGIQEEYSAVALSEMDMLVESKALVKTDEEIARELQTRWDVEDRGNNVAISNAASSLIDLSDDTASNECSSQGCKDTVTNASTSTVTCITAATKEEESIIHQPQEKNGKGLRNGKGERLDFEKFGDTFQLYHYNGLKGGILTPFRVTRLSPEEAVGVSISLSNGGCSGSGLGVGRGDNIEGRVVGNPGAGKTTDLEDIVRTKWPSCMFNWFGKNPPFID